MENPGNIPPEMSVKRKRGRPRKDEGSRSGGHRMMPQPQPVLSNNNNNGDQSGTVNPNEQTVAGVVDATFNGGYLITVKIGNTETTLKGVVFKPEQHVPLLSPQMISIGRNILQQQEAKPTKSSKTISSERNEELVGNSTGIAADSSRWFEESRMGRMSELLQVLQEDEEFMGRDKMNDGNEESVPSKTQ